MEQYIEAQKQAQRQSAMEKEKAEKQQKKYDEAMKKVADLEAQGKYWEAWSKLPPPDEFPNYADKIRKKRSEQCASPTRAPRRSTTATASINSL